jgi:coatomer subunit beta'
MPLRLAVKVKLQKRSERVKWIDVHSQEPWILTALYSGRLFIWNYETETLVKSFDVVEQTPVRSAKFVERNQWIVCGADDNHIRCYNYNTSELLKAFEAHSDYIRCVEVHPSLPYILSSSDDMSIKLWNWDKNWDLMQVFEGHIHYVMQVKFNPKDSNTFASASLDRTIKVWGIGSSTPHFTLTGHDKGVNCIDYYPGADKPYLLSGADDYKVKVWDYQTKACVATLESGASKGDGSDSGGGGGGAVGHTANVSAVAFHPKLPVIITASEDNTVRVWHSTTYRLESTLNYRLERAWTVGVSANSQKIAVGFDEGAIVLKLGKECPIVSMDSKSGKFIWVRNNEILTASVRGSGKVSSTVKFSVKKLAGFFLIIFFFFSFFLFFLFSFILFLTFFIIMYYLRLLLMVNLYVYPAKRIWVLVSSILKIVYIIIMEDF